MTILKIPVKIHLTPGGSGSTVEIDGKRMANVRSLTVKAAPREATVLTLEIIAVDVEITGDISQVITNGQ